MLSIGLTGNVASGKSAVSAIWAMAGVPIISADELAREAVEPGTRGLTEIVRAFGPEVLTSDGRLDRAAMRDRVFRDSAARKRLEGILHPRIAELRATWMTGQVEKNEPLVVAEIPLLFEVGMEAEFDRTVLVHAPEQVRLDRLVRMRGLDEAAARRIMSAQIPSERKREIADHVIENDGSLEELADAALELLGTLRTEAQIE